MTFYTIAAADAYISHIAQMLGAMVAYEEVTQSSQWDRGFNAQGRAYVACLSRNGAVLTDSNPPFMYETRLAGTHGWDQIEARFRLADKLLAIYG